MKNGDISQSILYTDIMPRDPTAAKMKYNLTKGESK